MAETLVTKVVASVGVEGAMAFMAAMTAMTARVNMFKASFAGMGIAGRDFVVLTGAVIGLSLAFKGLSASMKAATEQQYFAESLNNLLGSYAKAQRLIDRLRGWIIETPFTSPQARKAMLSMLAYGFKPEEILSSKKGGGGMLDTVAKLAAVSGKEGAFDRIAYALGQMSHRVNFSFLEMRQLIHANVPVIGMLSKALIGTGRVPLKAGETEAQAIKRVSFLVGNRTNPLGLGGNEAMQLIQKQVQKDPMYKDIMERQSATLIGRLRQMNDYFTLIGETSGPGVVALFARIVYYFDVILYAAYVWNRATDGFGILVPMLILAAASIMILVGAFVKFIGVQGAGAIATWKAIWAKITHNKAVEAETRAAGAATITVGMLTKALQNLAAIAAVVGVEGGAAGLTGAGGAAAGAALTARQAAAAGRARDAAGRFLPKAAVVAGAGEGAVVAGAAAGGGLFSKLGAFFTTPLMAIFGKILLVIAAIYGIAFLVNKGIEWANFRRTGKFREELNYDQGRVARWSIPGVYTYYSQGTAEERKATAVKLGLDGESSEDLAQIAANTAKSAQILGELKDAQKFGNFGPLGNRALEAWERQVGWEKVLSGGVL